MSLVTYTAVIAVRYPELDNVQNDLVCFGNYLLGEQATSGGFLPIFWDAPSAYMHAATDIGSAVDWLLRQVTLSSDENGCLAVLHNRNKMVATFGNSEWVTQSEGAVQSKSVTSCAGMTAHFVLLAQTKVGFLIFFFNCVAERAVFHLTLSIQAGKGVRSKPNTICSHGDTRAAGGLLPCRHSCDKDNKQEDASPAYTRAKITRGQANKQTRNREKCPRSNQNMRHMTWSISCNTTQSASTKVHLFLAHPHLQTKRGTDGRKESTT